ncbi:MAG: pyruvate kinase, partial [Candidatus Zixiibacteriota bacterium]
MKSTKIVATFGPAIASEKKVYELVEAGVNLFRINCSHGRPEDFKKAVKIIKSGSKSFKYPVGILFDLGGPKLRLGKYPEESAVQKGETIWLSAKSNGDGKVFTVNYPEIISALKKGEKVYVDDGNIQFVVQKVEKGLVELRAENSGTFTSGKGINLPDTRIPIPTITEKDKKDLKAAVELGADYIGLSFVRSPADIVQAKDLIKRQGGGVRVIAKLEKKDAIKSLEKIINNSDGVMVARGDLGVELQPEKLPLLQKKIIRMANRYHKPVIVATQMLESMRHSPRATRAEINDVAGAVFDFADAVMLSAETATGKYPVEAAKTMSAVIREVEKEAVAPQLKLDEHKLESDIPMAVAHAVSNSTLREAIKLIFAFTSSGFTAQLYSNLYPTAPIIAITTDKKVMQRLSLFRSVYAVQGPQPHSLDDT